MNKKFSQGLVLLSFLQVLALSILSQELKVEVEIRENDPSKILISGILEGAPSERELLFLLSYADSENLGSRISGLSLFDRNRKKIEYRTLAAGSYIAGGSYTSFSYTIDAGMPPNMLSTAHISWVSDQKGILRLNDLLPVIKAGYETTVALKLPESWKISTVEKASEPNIYRIRKNKTAIFVIGKGWLTRGFDVSETKVNLVLDEKWNVESSEMEKFARDILEKYESYFGAIPEKNLHIVNFKLPDTAGFDRWRAEASGANIIMMTAPTVFESRLRQRLQEQLRHELFHVWMPNNLALEGDYAWFYEGFAQYAALRAGVELNHITFNDFLKTLEQAYNFGNRRSQPISLIEASKNRWFTENSSVYAKGLAVAFLLDAALISHSRGKTDLIGMLGEIYGKYKLPQKTLEANAAILEVLESRRELAPITAAYVTGAEKLDFEKYLGQTGISIQPAESSIELRVKDDLSRREKDFLDKLGYNNWRKILSK